MFVRSTWFWRWSKIINFIFMLEPKVATSNTYRCGWCMVHELWVQTKADPSHREWHPIHLLVPCTRTNHGTPGTISVEHIAKPLKNYILNKHRNKLGLMRAHMYLWVELNLQYLSKARRELKNALDLEDLEIEASQDWWHPYGIVVNNILLMFVDQLKYLS
jgi:hypothetical protein